MTNERAGECASGVVVVAASEGLHARPAGRVVACANRMKAEIFLHLRGMEVNAKSLVMVLALGARQGDEVTITAYGDGAVEAVASVVSTIEAVSE